MVAVTDCASVVHALACRMLQLLWMYSLTGLPSVALGARAGSLLYYILRPQSTHFDTTIKLRMISKRALCGSNLQCGTVYKTSSETICNRQLAKRDLWRCALYMYDSYVSQLVMYSLHS